MKYTYLFFILFAVSACKKSFYTNANINPNAPSPGSIIPSVLLPSVEGALAYLQGGDLSRFSALNLQQVNGNARQAQAFYQYIYTQQDFDAVWGNIYADMLENNEILLQMADAKGYHAYSGIARILKAYMMQLTVDTWGSVPYTNALQGNSGNLKPSYQTDKNLYDTIAKLATDGIADLGNSDHGLLTPGDDDGVYAGKADRWIKFAHAIRARLFLHQSKGNATMAVNALREIAQSFASNADNAQYIFGNTETSANPWYQFNEQRTDISFSTSTAAAAMADLHDPRLPILIDTAIDGLLYYGVINAPVEFITYDELQFASAEAVLRQGGTIAEATAFYQLAIKSNMQKLGVKDADIATYLNFNGTLNNDVNTSIGLIAVQEYFALYLNPEAWALWRRTNSPALTPATGAGIPRRLLYPQSEYSYNKSNVPASVTLYSPKIFWDN